MLALYTLYKNLTCPNDSDEETPKALFFVVGFADEVTKVPESAVLVIVNGKKPSESAVEFNAIRAKATQDALHVWLHDFAPTVVVYDFFCLEARAVARLMGTPAICSIPATLRPQETETCSDGALPSEHMYWVWREPYEVAIRPVKFLGARPHPGNMYDLSERADGRPMVVVTFGTVIPEYAGCQERLRLIMAQLEAYAKQTSETRFFVFAGIQGPDLDNCYSYPDPLRCELRGLLPCHYLVFHGGGNTFAEAIESRQKYMLACPFFGDQFETARQCGNTYSGDLAHDMANLKPYEYPDVPALEDVPFLDRFPDYWRSGDLVFGHKRHRAALQRRFPKVDLHLEHYAGFGTFAKPEAGELPAIADVYNDELAMPCLPSPLSPRTPYYARLERVSRVRLQSTPSEVKQMPEDHQLVHYCLQILDLTVKEWSGRIHFVLGPADELGPATRIELEHIEKHWKELCDSVLFYDLEGRRVPAPWAYKAKNRAALPEPKSLPQDARLMPLTVPPERVPCVWGRNKHVRSIYEKRMVRKLPVLDEVGWRTGYVGLDDLNRLVEGVHDNWQVVVSWCQQRVWYYYFPHGVELQVWPWVFLHCFYLNQAGVATNMEQQMEAQKALEKFQFELSGLNLGGKKNE